MPVETQDCEGMFVGSDEDAICPSAMREGDILLVAGDEAVPPGGVADQVVSQRGTGREERNEAQTKRDRAPIGPHGLAAP